jgi:hypothetical protein
MLRRYVFLFFFFYLFNFTIEHLGADGHMLVPNTSDPRMVDFAGV